MTTNNEAQKPQNADQSAHNNPSENISEAKGKNPQAAVTSEGEASSNQQNGSSQEALVTVSDTIIPVAGAKSNQAESQAVVVATAKLSPTTLAGASATAAPDTSGVDKEPEGGTVTTAKPVVPQKVTDDLLTRMSSDLTPEERAYAAAVSDDIAKNSKIKAPEVDGGAAGGNGGNGGGGIIVSDDDDDDHDGGDGDGDGDDGDGDDGIDNQGGLGLRIDDGSNYTAGYQASPKVPGEILVPLSKLEDWELHPRFYSPRSTNHASALALSAADPFSLRPITVLKRDGAFVVVDGRYTVEQIRAMHPGDDTVLVRAVLFPGSEAEAVSHVCDAGLGTAWLTKMEQAHALYNQQKVSGVSNRAMAERYSKLTEDQVGQMVQAAKMQEAYPILYSVLADPSDAPISLGVRLTQAKKTMSEAAFAKLLVRAANFKASGERCEPSTLFEVLKIATEKPKRETSAKPSKPVEIVPVESEMIAGDDDMPIGAYEKLADGFHRIRLPDVAGMPATELTSAFEACVKQLRRHFGLDY